MLKLSADAAKPYTPEQQEYIEKYAAGLLISWTAEHITNFITPDIGDGFCPPEGVFPSYEEEEAAGNDPLEWQAHNEVITLLEDWLEVIARQVGFKSGDQAASFV